MIFLSKTYGKVDENGIARILREELKRDPKRQYVLAIGSDSQNTGETRLVEVIALQRLGNGGIFFYRTEHLQRIHSMQQRLFTEVQRTVEIAHTLMDALDLLYLEDDFHYTDYDISLEVHCDVGSNGRSSQMLQEISGFVKGTTQEHYQLRTKPDAFAASAIADRFSK